ncbi:MAG: hypothetical protein LBJ32_02220 [Oscillospiraceae bacterium]|jgi:hypothetical protein|nr:hypothetical protein [Oscillospiraceae bacterium]
MVSIKHFSDKVLAKIKKFQINYLNQDNIVASRTINQVKSILKIQNLSRKIIKFFRRLFAASLMILFLSINFLSFIRLDAMEHCMKESEKMKKINNFQADIKKIEVFLELIEFRIGFITTDIKKDFENQLIKNKNEFAEINKKFTEKLLNALSSEKPNLDEVEKIEFNFKARVDALKDKLNKIEKSMQTLLSELNLRVRGMRCIGSKIEWRKEYVPLDEAYIIKCGINDLGFCKFHCLTSELTMTEKISEFFFDLNEVRNKENKIFFYKKIKILENQNENFYHWFEQEVENHIETLSKDQLIELKKDFKSTSEQIANTILKVLLFEKISWHEVEEIKLKIKEFKNRYKNMLGQNKEHSSLSKLSKLESNTLESQDYFESFHRIFVVGERINKVLSEDPMKFLDKFFRNTTKKRLFFCYSFFRQYLRLKLSQSSKKIGLCFPNKKKEFWEVFKLILSGSTEAKISETLFKTVGVSIHEVQPFIEDHVFFELFENADPNDLRILFKFLFYKVSKVLDKHFESSDETSLFAKLSVYSEDKTNYFKLQKNDKLFQLFQLFYQVFIQGGSISLLGDTEEFFRNFFCNTSKSNLEFLLSFFNTVPDYKIKFNSIKKNKNLNEENIAKETIELIILNLIDIIKQKEFHFEIISNNYPEIMSFVLYDDFFELFQRANNESLRCLSDFLKSKVGKVGIDSGNFTFK